MFKISFPLQDYESTDTLFYATDRALAAVGSSLFDKKKSE